MSNRKDASFVTGRRTNNSTAEYTGRTVTEQVIDDTKVNHTCILIVDVVWTESVAAMTVKTNTNLQAVADMRTRVRVFFGVCETNSSCELAYSFDSRQDDLKTQGPAHSDSCSCIQLV